MSSLRNLVASFIRFVSAGLLLLGFAWLLLAWLAQRQGEAALRHWFFGVLTVLVSVLLLVFSAPLARRFTRDYD